MNRRTLALPGLLLVLSLAPLATTATVAGDEPSPPFCYRTAQNLYLSCTFDANDDFWEARAACINLATEAERVSCRADSVADATPAKRSATTSAASATCRTSTPPVSRTPMTSRFPTRTST
jgi:hypothetical protein